MSLREAMKEPLPEGAREAMEKRRGYVEAFFDLREGLDSILSKLILPPPGVWIVECGACGKRCLKFPISDFGRVDNHPHICIDCGDRDSQIFVRELNQDEIDEVNAHFDKVNEEMRKA